MLQTHTLAYSSPSLRQTHTHTLRQLTVSSPLCHIRDAATLWASDTHTPRSAVSHLLRCVVWEDYTSCFFAYCMCESVSVHVLVSICSASSWRSCHSLYQPEENTRDTHSHMCTHQSKPSQNSAILNPISVQASNFSPQTHNGAATEKGRGGRRESGKTRDESERWGEEKRGEPETKVD